MMRLVVEKQNVHLILTMQQMAKLLASERAMTEAHRGVIDAGRRTKTQVQRAVFHQMAMTKYQFVSSNTRGTPDRASLAFHIYAHVGGQRVEMYKGLRALKISGEAASRLNTGRAFGDWGTVRSGVWNVPRIFKRSFATGGGYFALLPGKGGRAPKALWTFGLKPGQPRDDHGRFAKSERTYGPVRRLFGPSLKKELTKGESLAVFQAVAPQLLIEKVEPRLAKLMKW